MPSISRATRRIAALILFGAAALWLLFSLPENSLALLFDVCSPLLLGLVFAFLLDLLMQRLDTWLLKGRGGRANRPLLFALALFLVLLSLCLLVFLVVPQLAASLSQLADSMPTYLEQAGQWLAPLTGALPQLQNLVASLDLDLSALSARLWDLFSTGGTSLLGSLFSFATSLFSGAASFFIALFFAFDLVLGKKRWLHGMQVLSRVFLPPGTAHKAHTVLAITTDTFGKYIGGQLIEATVVGALFFLVLALSGFPYAALISVLTAITSFIPLFGAYIACAIGILLIFIASGFWRTVAFVVIFVVLQQLDGNILYPRVVGSSVGLSPGLILVAVTVGGGLFGIGGILFFIPLFSVLQKLVKLAAKKQVPQGPN